jgi:hypothetical protein
MALIVPIIIDRTRDNQGFLGFDGFFDEMVKQYNDAGTTQDNISTVIKTIKKSCTHKLAEKIEKKERESYYAKTKANKIVDELAKAISALPLDGNTLFRLIWSARLSFLNVAYPSELIRALLDKFVTNKWMSEGDYTNIKFFIITEDPRIYDFLDRYNPKNHTPGKTNLIQDDDVYDRSFFIDNKLAPNSNLQDDIERFVTNFFQDK